VIAEDTTLDLSSIRRNASMQFLAVRASVLNAGPIFLHKLVDRAIVTESISYEVSNLYLRHLPPPPGKNMSHLSSAH
jgi:hypothetical protein